MNSQIEQFLRQLCDMPREARLQWLNTQGSNDRQVILQHIETQRAELLGRQWQLGQARREVQARQGEAMSALDRLALVRRLVVGQLAEHFHEIYADPNLALQGIWTVASVSPEDAQRALLQTPERFGALAGRRILGMDSLRRRQARKAARAMNFIKIWDSYSQIEVLNQQLQTGTEAVRHVRH